MIEKSRAPRKVEIADHLWDVFELMAEEMGSDREGLVNQAMFMFARLNGYLTPGPKAAGQVEAPAREPSIPKVAAVPREPVEPLDPVAPPMVEDEDTPAGAGARGPDLGAAAPITSGTETAGAPLKGDGRRRHVEKRVLETAAELERQIRGRSERPPDPPVLEQSDDEDDELIDDEIIEDPIDPPADEIDDDEIVDELMGDVQEAKSLYLMAADGELDKVAKERFLIGRGKHCDLVVQSGKVSREHAVIVTEPDGYFIEDLGSSNGTWFQKKRIKKRQIEDGDEFYICSEKIKCVIR
ncbi:MAG: FHA domain-containing protein [Myxococcota bacterium]